MLGEKIKQARKAAHLTQKQLGLLCGYKESSAERIVQLWEHGKVNPPIEKLRLICSALNTTLEELIP